MWNVKCSKWSSCSSNRMKRNDRKNKPLFLQDYRENLILFPIFHKSFLFPWQKHAHFTTSCLNHFQILLFYLHGEMGHWTGKGCCRKEHFEMSFMRIMWHWDILWCLGYSYGFVIWYTWDIRYYIYLVLMNCLRFMTIFVEISYKVQCRRRTASLRYSMRYFIVS